MMYKCLLVIVFAKMTLAFIIGSLLFIPTEFVHRQFGALTTNQSYSVDSNFWGCSIPRVNFKITEKDVTEALDLPSNTLLTGQLKEAGKCKSAMESFQSTDVGECFCTFFGSFGQIYGLLLLGLGALLLIDVFAMANTGKFSMTFLLNLPSVRNQRLTKMKLESFLCSLVVFRTAGSVYYYNEYLRYTLPNSIFYQPYFEVPLTWWLILGFCTGFMMLIWPIEYTVLTSARMVEPHLSPRTVTPTVQSSCDKVTVAETENRLPWQFCTQNYYSTQHAHSPVSNVTELADKPENSERCVTTNELNESK